MEWQKSSKLDVFRERLQLCRPGLTNVTAQRLGSAVVPYRFFPKC